eukprot:g2990.t1
MRLLVRSSDDMTPMFRCACAVPLSMWSATNSLVHSESKDDGGRCSEGVGTPFQIFLHRRFRDQLCRMLKSNIPTSTLIRASSTDMSSSRERSLKGYRSLCDC